MAAGLGFKTFNTGDVLSAADVNGYLMQGVLVFADATARDAAITSPQEGQFAFTKNNDSLWYYNGTSWVASGATGDIEGVTAGVGISGGGTSGTVTITNDMATTITASGDIVIGTGSGTYDNLPIGTTGQVLTADTTVSPYKVKWATAAAGGGGMTSLASGSLSGSSLDLQTISGSYQQLTLVLRNAQTQNDTEVRVRLNNLTTGIYNGLNNLNNNGTPDAVSNANATSFYATYWNIDAGTTSAMILDVYDYVNTSAHKQVRIQYGYTRDNATIQNTRVVGTCRTTNAIDRITVFPDAGNWTAGTYELFGVK